MLLSQYLLLETKLDMQVDGFCKASNILTIIVVYYMEAGALVSS